MSLRDLVRQESKIASCVQDGTIVDGDLIDGVLENTWTWKHILLVESPFHLGVNLLPNLLAY